MQCQRPMPQYPLPFAHFAAHPSCYLPLSAGYNGPVFPGCGGMVTSVAGPFGPPTFDRSDSEQSLHFHSEQSLQLYPAHPQPSSPPSPSCAKPSRSLVIRPRRKTGEAKGTTDCTPVVLTYDILQSLFCKPLHVAAKSLGISATAFKKVCRSFGVRNWPYRFQDLMQGGALENQSAEEETEHKSKQGKTVFPEEKRTEALPEVKMEEEKEEDKQEKEKQEPDEQEEHADGQAQEERGWEAADGAGNSGEEAEELRVLLEQSRSVWGAGRGGSELDLSFETAQGWLVSPVDAHTLPVWGPDHV